MANVPGVVMTDPADRRRTVWVQEKDRADFERRGYVVVPSEAERSASKSTRLKTEPATKTPSEQSPPAGDGSGPDETPATGGSTEPETATTPQAEPPTPGVTFPRRAQRKKP